MARILFIDDDAGGRQMAAYNLRGAGHEVTEGASGRSALDSFDANACDLVITDVRMPGMSGIEVTREIRKQASDIPILVITAFGGVDIAVDAMKAGANDFVIKPFSRDQLLLVVDKALERQRLENENRALRRELRGIERPIVHRSRQMEETLATADQVAKSNAYVLVTGESGTGKELVARRIHSRSARSEGPFVAVSCAAIPHDLMEAELFGHEKGAFTGAVKARDGRFRRAHGGTLFLDEVGELPLSLQGKLLRVLQEGVVDVVGSDRSVNVDVRVVAATNRDLLAEVKAQQFREDLYFRLAVVEVHVPPLRERPDDIAALTQYFVDEIAEGREVVVPEEVLAALAARPWSGNVRELRNACERMVALSVGDSLDVDTLPQVATAEGPPASEGHGWPHLPPEGLSLLDLEKSIIEKVLALKDGNLSEAARYLRIPRHILVYRVQKYGIARHGKK